MTNKEFDEYLQKLDKFDRTEAFRIVYSAKTLGELDERILKAEERMKEINYPAERFKEKIDMVLREIQEERAKADNETV